MKYAKYKIKYGYIRLRIYLYASMWEYKQLRRFDEANTFKIYVHMISFLTYQASIVGSKIKGGGSFRFTDQ